MSIYPVARVPAAASRSGAVVSRLALTDFLGVRFPGAVARPLPRRASSFTCVAFSTNGPPRSFVPSPVPGAAARAHAPRARLPKVAPGRFLTRAGKPGGGAFGGLPDGTDDLLKKYGDTARATGQFIGKASGLSDTHGKKTSSSSSRGGVVGRKRNGNGYSDGNGVFLLLLVNVVLYALDQWVQVPVMKSLYLNHMHPRWWQFVTSIFCHANWAHLSGNIFFLYVFGNIVEQEEGFFGVWFSYLFTGIGAGVASYLMLPKGVGGVLGMAKAATVSLGASGAVFGLFAVSVLTKLRMDFRKLLEAVILGQFVVERFLSEAKMAAAAGGVGAGGVNHVAHLAGALVGVALIWTISRILPPE